MPPAGKLSFSNIVFDFVGLFLVDILVRNLSLPPQTKTPRYGPVYSEKATRLLREGLVFLAAIRSSLSFACSMYRSITIWLFGRSGAT